MSVSYPAMASTIAGVQVVIIANIFGISGPLLGGLVVGTFLTVGAIYLYSPLPNSNGGMVSATDGGYWGWTPKNGER